MTETSRQTRLNVRVNEFEAEVIARAATSLGITAGEFARIAILGAAHRRVSRIDLPFDAAEELL